MKVLIIALNAKYIHASLAPWYLKASCGEECGEVKVMEFTVNDSREAVLSAIYREKPDVAAFSCYIWNIRYVLKLLSDIRKVLPHCINILGGPEVSYDAVELAKANPEADYILCGEGEEIFGQLLKRIVYNRPSGRQGATDTQAMDSLGVDGLCVGARHVDSPCMDGRFHIVRDLDRIPSPYSPEMLERIGTRIAYFESSRGCPFSCSYCLSSTYEGVRFFSMDRVRSDLTKLIEAGVAQVKFVDRTFNCNTKRAGQILRFILDYAGDRKMNFHFEAAADLFDDSLLHILSEAPPGLFQLEIGIQTANSKALEAVERKTNLEKAFDTIRRLREMKNVHLHLGLIAGLPFEDFDSFRNTFDRVYALGVHQLQLGFLKMLKGSKIRKEADKHGIVFRQDPPYEILFNRYMAFNEILDLKGIEDMVEKYANSGKFSSSLNFLLRFASGTGTASPVSGSAPFISYPAFNFFYLLYKYHEENGYADRLIAIRDRYVLLWKFAEAKMNLSEENRMLFHELLLFDFLASDNSGSPPEMLMGTDRLAEGDRKERIERNNGPVSGQDAVFKARCLDFLKNEDNIRRFLPEFVGIPAKQILRRVHFHHFSHDVTLSDPASLAASGETVVLFNYASRDRVTGLYQFSKIEL